MTYRVGEFVPSDRAEMGEGTLPLEPFLSCWNPKDGGVSRGTQWTGRDINAKEIRQVQRNSIWDSIAQEGNFVIDPLSYWKPVQFSRKWWKVCAIGGFENESSRTVLNLLKFVNQLLRNPWQQEIIVIKAWQNRGYHKGFGCINCEDMSNWTNSTQFVWVSGAGEKSVTCLITKPRQSLQNHPSGHLGGWATPWSAEDMLDGQRQRADVVPARAKAAHMGLLQKRLEEDLCWIVPPVPSSPPLTPPPDDQLGRGTELNWTELMVWPSHWPEVRCQEPIKPACEVQGCAR